MNIYSQTLSYLAKKAMLFRYAVAPNPAVGAAILYENKIVAEGYHTHFGGEHAEIVSINIARKKGIPLHKSTLIVTLEPCTHTGKTPPCVNQILKEKIPTVIIGTQEHNSTASGGSKLLQEHGVNVSLLNTPETEYAIQDFRTWNKYNIPHIIIKLASTIDGYIATSTGESKWITNEASRKQVQELRKNIADVDGAILVGANTIRYDNPKLCVRDLQSKKHPRPIIISTTLEGLEDSFIIQERAKECIIITSHLASTSPIGKILKKKGITYIPVGYIDDKNDSSNKRLHIKEALEILYKTYNILYILCEGGGMLTYSLLEANIPLELYHFIAPTLFADITAKSMIFGAKTPNLSSAFSLTLEELQKIDNDILAIYSKRE